jgi:hypothetical protein
MPSSTKRPSPRQCPAAGKARFGRAANSRTSGRPSFPELPALTISFVLINISGFSR